MSYNTKNYTEQGGDKTVIKGELSIEEDGVFKIDGASLSKALYQSDSEASDLAGLIVDFNKMLGKLRSVGIMFADAPVITLLSEPEDVEVQVGNISEELIVEAKVTGKAVLTYQWYSSESDSNTGGTIVSGATSSEFSIPTNLTETTYYYCVVSALEADSVSTQAITVTLSGS